MKVYVLENVDYDSTVILGVYKSNEKAKLRKDELDALEAGKKSWNREYYVIDEADFYE